MISPEKLAWTVGVLAVVVVAAGIGYAAPRWQREDGVLHLEGYDIRESDWRVAARLWVYSRPLGSTCTLSGPLSSELASAAQSPGYPAGSTGSLTGEDWGIFLRRPALTAVEGQVASKDDFRKATEILKAECRKRRPPDWLWHPPELGQSALSNPDSERKIAAAGRIGAGLCLGGGTVTSKPRFCCQG